MNPIIDLKLQGDGAWPDLATSENVIEAQQPLQMAMLHDGMSSGARSVTIRLNTPDGKAVLIQTSLGALSQAVKAMEVAP